jgi:hypothetical protein
MSRIATHFANVFLAVVLWSCLAAPIDNVVAAPRDPARQGDAAAKKKFCDSLKASYDANMEFYRANPARRGKWKRTAENIRILAEGNNCKWAAI